MLKITKPTLLVDESIAKTNIQAMAKKAVESGVEFRPHFKTHFSHEIGDWYRAAGVDKITVSSIDMAFYFAKNGWRDITIAFPCNILEIDALNTLAKNIQLNLVVESPESARYLSQHLSHPAAVFIKIDTGYGRAGVRWDSTSQIHSIIEEVKQKTYFKGLLTHFGHTYKEHNEETIRQIHQSEVQRINETKESLDLAEVEISIGDTPSCSVVQKFDKVHEIRPGNFIFYDLMQYKIGSCAWNQIAVCMVCPVVAIHQGKNEIVIHGGAVHFSKDHLLDKHANPYYGQVVELKETTHWGDAVEGAFLKSVSQEHGVLSYPTHLIEQLAVGDLVGIIPVHSCLTANLMKDYLTVSGRKITTMNSVPERSLH